MQEDRNYVYSREYVVGRLRSQGSLTWLTGHCASCLIRWM